MRPYTEEEKAKLTKRELARLRRIFKNIPEDKRQLVEGLIQEAAFMRATLEEARAIIDRDGVIENFEQGAQRFLREHPATKVYASMVNRYTTVCNRLLELLPTSEARESKDELMAFVKRAG